VTNALAYAALASSMNKKG